MAKKAETSEVTVIQVESEQAHFLILGETPLIFHRMAEKAKRELLLPKGRKTAADKAATLKHDPLNEYRASMYRTKPDGDPATRLVFPGAAFHKALSDAALDLPGLKKAQIGRLCGVIDFDVAIYGIPQMLMSVVRNSDMARTPDIRTRAIVPQWACRVGFRFTKPLVKQRDVVHLMVAAGMFIGIGDNRQQKGAGSYGLWSTVDDDNPDFIRLIEHCGREAQDAAIENPAPYDLDTQDLYAWYQQEMRNRADEPLIKARSKRRIPRIDEEEAEITAQEFIQGNGGTMETPHAK